MNFARFWAYFATNPQRLHQLRTVALATAGVMGVLSVSGLVILNRVHTRIQTYRAQALAPQEIPSLSPEEEALHSQISAIYEQITQVPNPQAYAIGRLNALAQQYQLNVLSVETSDVPDAEPTSNGWLPRLIRFRLAGSSVQLVNWLIQLERVPLILKTRGVQMGQNPAKEGVEATVEVEVVLPQANPQLGGTTS